MKRGSLLWNPTWSTEKVKQFLKVTKERGIEVEDIGKWETAIRMASKAEEERG